MSTHKRIPISKSAVGAAVVLAEVNASRSGRDRVPTVKGALYAQELAKENQVTKSHHRNRNKKNQPQSSVIMPPVIGHSDDLPQFAPVLEDPFEPLLADVQATITPKRPLQPTENIPFKSIMVYPRTQSKLPMKRVIANHPTSTPASNQTGITFSNTPPPGSSSSAPSRVIRTHDNVPSGQSVFLSHPVLSPQAQKRTYNEDDEESDSPGHNPTKPHIASTQSQRKRSKAGDVPKEFRSLLTFAIANYRSVLATQCPYPNAMEEGAYAASVLSKSMALLETSIDDKDTYDLVVELMIARDSHMRGELRTKIIPLVSSHYGFNNSGSKRAIRTNRNLHTTLKYKDSFLFQEPAKRRGLYENPILQAAINEMWFRDHHDEGIKFNTYFEPIPLKTIALVFTVIEYVLDRWATGMYRNTVSFTAKEYRDVYERHLSSLEATRAYSSVSASKLLRIQRRLYSRACKFAGIKPKKDLVILDDEAIAAFEQSDVSEAEGNFESSSGDSSSSSEESETDDVSSESGQSAEADEQSEVDGNVE